MRACLAERRGRQNGRREFPLPLVWWECSVKLSLVHTFSSLSCAGSSWLPLLLVSFPSFSLLPTPHRPCQSERSSKARHEADSFEAAEWSERLTPGQSGWLGAAAVGSIPALVLSSTSVFSSLSSTSVFISSRCSFSCHSPLCPAPVRPGCLFCLFLSLLSPSSQPPIDRVSPNVALKLVTKPILLKRLSGLSD